MKIAICDDEIVFVKKLYIYLWQQPDCSVDCYLSPTDLLAKYEAGERYDAVFLDWVMSPLSGIDTALRIRTFDTRVILVFISAHLEYAPSGYEVNAFRYLLKPLSEPDVSRVMADIRRELETSPALLLKTPECEMILHPQEILYLESDNKNTILHCRDDRITLRKGSNELEMQLTESAFFRIHRKYVVNLEHVREFDESRLTLDSGETLPISRRRSRDFHAALKNYVEGDTRS